MLRSPTTNRPIRPCLAFSGASAVCTYIDLVHVTSLVVTVAIAITADSAVSPFVIEAYSLIGISYRDRSTS